MKTDAQQMMSLLDLLNNILRAGSGETDTSKKSNSLVIGEKYLIRTVTMTYTGRVVEINDFNLVLDNAAWIADTGRFSEALSTGVLNEVEPYPSRCNVSLQSIIDFSPWSHDLPMAMK